MVSGSTAGGSPDFTLALSSSSIRVAGGQSAAFEAQLTSSNGFQGDVILSIDCGGLTVTFNPSTTGSPVILLQPEETAVALVVIRVPYNATEGVYCGTLTATSNGLVRLAQLRVEVPPFGVGTRLIHRLLEQGSRVDLLLTFPSNSCFQVREWESVARASNAFSLQVILRNETSPDGTCPQITRTIGNLYSLGHLSRDNYTFSLVICLQNNDQVVCRDSETLTFTTIDNTSPRWPSDSEIRVRALTPTTVTITWTYVDDNLGVAKYRIYVGSQLVGMTGGNIVCAAFWLCLHYNATGLVPGQTYTLRIEACDLSGNCSLGPTRVITMPEQPQLPGQQTSVTELQVLLLIGVAVLTIAVGLLIVLLPRRGTNGNSEPKGEQ